MIDKIKEVASWEVKKTGEVELAIEVNPFVLMDLAMWGVILSVAVVLAMDGELISELLIGYTVAHLLNKSK